MFGKPHAGTRNGFFWGSGRQQTLLSLLVERIDDEQRQRIFPGTFDLGNQTKSDAVFLKKDLVKELAQEFGTVNAELLTPNKAFKYIDPWIAAITGQTTEQHLARNSLKTLKVLKLFYRIMKQRRRTIFQLIRPLQDLVRPSMEHRDRHPLLKSEEQVWLLADIKAYLRMELDVTRATRIDAAFEALLPRLEGIINYLNGYVTLNRGDDISALEKTTDSMIRAIFDNIDTDTTLDASSEALLDEHLYFYLQSLEFLNYAGEYTQIVEATTPQTPITPIVLEIEMLREKLWQSGVGPYSGGPIAPLTESASIYATWKKDLAPLIEKAIRIPLESQKYDSLVKPAEELLYRHFMFKWGVEDPTQYSLGIFEYLNAACAIWHEMNTNTTYNVYWLGQPSQGQMILSTLDKSLRANLHPSAESVPEALNQIWVRRYRWIADAIKGQQQTNATKSKATMAVLHHVAATIRSGNIASIEKIISAAPSFVTATQMSDA